MMISKIQKEKTVANFNIIFHFANNKPTRDEWEIVETFFCRFMAMTC